MLNEVIVAAPVDTPEQVPSMTYWDNTKASNLLSAHLDNEKALQMIIILKASNQAAERYIMLIEGRYSHNPCTQQKVYELQQCCAILCMHGIHICQGTNGQSWHNTGIVLYPVMFVFEQVWNQANTRLAGGEMVEYSIFIQKNASKHPNTMLHLARSLSHFSNHSLQSNVIFAIFVFVIWLK